MKSKTPQLTEIFALAFWLFLAGLRLGQAWQQRSLLALLLTLQAGLVAYALTTRRGDTAQVPCFQKLVAWLSAFLPFLLQVSIRPGLIQLCLAMCGLALAVWGMFTLGKSFGIAPADRGLIFHGPYHYLRHPIYAGELLAVLAIVLGEPSPRNAPTFTVLLLTVLARIRWEERALGGYGGYACQVRWRLIPGLW
jgi:protein-S-isoprenylcysteine O-methyltransferase Ste14